MKKAARGAVLFGHSGFGFRASGFAGAALLLAWACCPAQAGLRPLPPRTAVNLDGTWQAEEGGMDSPPAAYTHTAPVPGLADMAEPPFKDVGRKSALRQAFWYRRTFKVAGPLPDVAVLKIHKARYGTRVFLNGKAVGDHLPCFTPAYMPVREHLRAGGAENELVVRVGADRECIPPDMPAGWDIEKYLFIPGIYDSVELILAGAPYIVNVQAAADVAGKAVRVVAELQAAGKPCQAALRAEVAEGAGRAVAGGTPAVPGGDAGARPAVASAAAPPVHLEAGEKKTVDLAISIPNCRLWSPEDPFLYDLRLATGADAASVRFGMRSFRFDPESGRAVLNGRTYYLRGSNVTCYRFFEDADRKDLPWRAEWVRRLHRKFKSMHWNSLRYCIGFPPELWYDIADEEGLLIQDEFPIWLANAPEKPVAGKIIPQYADWMRERWNHPCVVIWDAQNESVTPETGKAIQAVRGLDLSSRPWDNGWSEPQSAADCVEAHPYLFVRGWQGKEPFRLKEIAGMSGEPRLRAEQKKLPAAAVIINEYGWLWLTRDGQPTCLTQKVYEGLLGPNSTVEQRRVLYGRYLAALTEFWRCRRQCAGVLHFCGLGYSRPGDKPRPEGGATSDHFLDLETLALEPNFERYVRDAFSPVGLMLDFWAEELTAGAAPQQVKVYVINDLYDEWRGKAALCVLEGGRPVSQEEQDCTVPPLGRTVLSFTLAAPARAGAYTAAAELRGAAGPPVRSLRDFRVTAQEKPPAPSP